jgi:hypothetical protein
MMCGFNAATRRGGILHDVRRAESARLQADNAERSEAMQGRLLALQTLKDDVNEAVRYMASLDQKVPPSSSHSSGGHSLGAFEPITLPPASLLSVGLQSKVAQTRPV